ncbi:AfsR/SARP family transcriptional regulator [Sinosporangium siamense]|uniref:Bacterial transcriptional activator domain-containing protein n=1 Tax=Sinosporangium siamense TaxID=1367973 RepID=A0A919RN26_9ACTN|nr:BTAD domain-containing putative transcriptional regulator [Sinosporangium siamense]GII95474.1 hypothetical protein Ssi02_57050 [Sinosporangium siamense]
MEFHLFGPVRASDGQQAIKLGQPAHRVFLTAMLWTPGRKVGREELIRARWEPEERPRHASDTLTSYLGDLRRTLGHDLLPRCSGGYLVRVARDRVDLHRFLDKIKAAHTLGRTNGSPTGPPADATPSDRQRAMWRAAELFKSALEIWSFDSDPLNGPEPFADLSGSWIEGRRTELLRKRHAAVVDWLNVELAIGRHREHLNDLITLAERTPESAEIIKLLAIAHYRCGNVDDALRVLGELIKAQSQKGLDPLPWLFRLQSRIAAQDDALAAPPFARPEPPAEGRTEPRAEPRVKPLPRDGVAAAPAFRAAAPSPAFRTTAGRAIALIAGARRHGSTAEASRRGRELTDLVRARIAEDEEARRALTEANGSPRAWRLLETVIATHMSRDAGFELAVARLLDATSVPSVPPVPSRKERQMTFNTALIKAPVFNESVTVSGDFTLS